MQPAARPEAETVLRLSGITKRFGALTAVLSSGGRGTWAAGWQSDRTVIRPLLLRWTGSRWERHAIRW